MKKYFLYILPLAVVLFSIVNVVIDEPTFDSFEEEVKHYNSVKDYTTLCKKLEARISEDSLNVDLHYEYITAHFQIPAITKDLFGDSEQRFDDEIFYTYKSFSESNDVVLSDLGNFGLAMCYYHLRVYTEAIRHLKKIENDEHKYLNFFFGKFNLAINTEKSEEFLFKEIENDGYVSESCVILAELYDYNDDMDSLLMLTNHEGCQQFVPLHFKRKAYFLNEHWGSYIKSILSRFNSNFNFYGFVGAVLILLIWVIYLVRLNIYKTTKVFPIIYMLVTGMSFALLTSVLTDFNKYQLGFSLNGDVGNDFLYCFFGIGMIEEAVKIIPLLLLLPFKKFFREPIDYIIYASIGALGFSFVENILYFDYDGLSTMQGRALSATVSHMFNSSVIAYGVVLGTYLKKYRVWSNLIFFFIVAALAHGLYDFWLINSFANRFSFLTFLQLLVSMFIWTSFINNCLNNSSRFDAAVKHNPSRLNDYLLFSFTFVFLFEYLVVAIQHGTTFANQTLLSDIISGSFLMLFLAVSLSRFDLIRNYWAPIKFWDWGALMNVPKMKPTYFDFKELVGKQVEFSLIRSNDLLNGLLPVSGQIVSRELVSWEKDWYLVRLDNPLNLGWLTQEFVLIKPKDNTQLFQNGKEQIVHFRVVNNIDDLSKKHKNKSDFWFLDYVLVQS